MPYRGVLFDKDGTLIDLVESWSTPYRAAADALARAAGQDAWFAEELLARHGYRPSSGRFADGSILVWGTNLDVIEAWRREPELREIDVLAIAGPHLTTPGRYPPAPAIDDLPGLFARLELRGLALGVATMDSEAKARADLETLGLSARFLAGADSGHGCKPAPGMALAFARAMGLAPSACVIVGDSVADLEMGRAAGFGARIGVLTGGTSAAALERHADRVLDDIGTLEAFLDG